MSHVVCRLTLYTNYETLGNPTLIYELHVLKEMTVRQDWCLHQL